MPFETISPADEIFLDEDALRDHFPDRIHERDDLLEEYANAFKEVVRNKRPRNVFVHGPTGVGKTVGTMAVLDKIHESIQEYDYDSDPNIDEPSLKTVHLNCEDLNTSYQVSAHLINELRDGTDRDRIATTGYPEGEINNKLYEELRKIEESHVLIALDEIDNIGNDDTILYKLPRCNNDNSAKYVDPENTAVGVIGITNEANYLETVDPRVRNTLAKKEINFPSYDASELQTIVADRANVAFHDDAVGDAVIPLVGALAAQRSGYARTALDLLYTAGDIARSQDDHPITEEHVRQAEEKIQRSTITTEVEGLSLQGKLITYTLLRMKEGEETPAKLDKVTIWYERFAEIAGVNTVTSRTIHETLNTLMMEGIATSKEINKGRSGGRHYEYDLAVRPKLIVDGLEDDDTIQSLNDKRF